MYSRNHDREVWSKEPAALPEAIQRSHNGAGKQFIQDLFYKRELCLLRYARLVTQVLQVPGSKI